MSFRACLVFVTITALPLFAAPAKGTEILWDRYGVPHIYAKDTASTFYALGYAQMQSHGNLLLQLYGSSRGRAAEYWGESFLPDDLYLHTVGLTPRAQQWRQQQSPEFRAYLDQFAEGINAYAKEHPEALSEAAKRVLPVTGLDPLLHAERVMYFEYVAPAKKSGFRSEIQGSNAWAVAPSHTVAGNALLLANPHQTWSGAMLFYEAHLNAPGFNVYGAMQVGFPVMRYAFNDNLGFSQTVNTIDVADTYRLTLKDGGYLFDGEVKQFEKQEDVVQVRRPDGTLRAERITIRRSVHGPVISTQGGTALALRVGGLDRPGLLEQYWSMATARDFASFQAALAKHQVPMFTVMYADRAGHIMHLFNGILPERPQGTYAQWQGITPGDSSATLWTRILPLSDMPRVIDPPAGWLQNTNDPPWSTTYPMALDPAKFPAYVAPRTLSLRTGLSVKMLSSHPKVSFDEFIALKLSTRVELADRILDELVVAAGKSGEERTRRAAQVLQSWDRQFEASSRGAVLFELFGSRWLASATPSPYRVPADIREPLTTPMGLRDPQSAVAILSAAAKDVESAYGRLDVAWGEAHRFQSGGVDLPANGGSSALGVFRAMSFGPGSGGRTAAYFGDTYVAAIEFSNPVHAKVLLSYGNSSQPNSPHRTDQFPLLSRKQLRTAWRTRAEVQANLEERKVF